jgi:hypothetical protein
MAGAEVPVLQFLDYPRIAQMDGSWTGRRTCRDLSDPEIDLGEQSDCFVDQDFQYDMVIEY